MELFDCNLHCGHTYISTFWGGLKVQHTLLSHENLTKPYTLTSPSLKYPLSFCYLVCYGLYSEFFVKEYKGVLRCAKGYRRVCRGTNGYKWVHRGEKAYKEEQTGAGCILPWELRWFKNNNVSIYIGPHKDRSAFTNELRPSDKGL